MKRLFAVAMTLLLGLSQFVTAQVSTDYDRSVDFRQNTTFAFTKPVYSSPLLMNNIQGNLVRELGERGLSQQTTNPDLLVKVYTYTEDKTRNVSNGPAYGPFLPYRWGFFLYRFGYWPVWGGYSGGRNQTYR